MLSVSEYVSTNVTAKPVNCLHETNNAPVLWSLICPVVILSLLQENKLFNSIPHRVKSRTEAVNHLSRSLDT